MRTSDFDFDLPASLIAQRPTPIRDGSRLMVLHRKTGAIEHRLFRDLPDLLKSGDLLVHNNSRVIAARLFASNSHTSGRFEILLLEQNAKNDWWAMLKPGKRAQLGTVLTITGPAVPVTATVIEINAEGHRRLLFNGVPDILLRLGEFGKVPLPPYITRPADEQDGHRYQTVYAAASGSVAAPTAGLHFTDELLRETNARGVQSCFVTLHVGIGTFAPVKAEDLAGHAMHEERFDLPPETAASIQSAKASQKRVVVVGTTSLRVLETVAAANQGTLPATQGRTRIFIHPPHHFRIADILLTNFHLPRSTLLMLVSAFAAPGETNGRELVLHAYREAVRERYRFFSYGDAMLIL